MNKSTLLTAGLVIGIVVVLGYTFLGDNAESVQNQQPVKNERAQVKAHLIQPSSEAKSESIASDNISEQNTAVFEEREQVRRAPPPPIIGVVSREVAHSSPQAHGHEEHSDDDQQRNAPPPPTGANQ